MAIPLDILRGRGGGDFGFDNGITILVLNRARLETLGLPGGMVYRWATNLGREMALVAQNKLVPGHGYRTGELRRSISHSVTPAGGSVAMNVRASAKHAVFYHEGTRPHHEEANPPKKFMHWVDLGFSPGVGGFSIAELGASHFARAVSHPGYHGTPFLRDAQREVLAARGILR